MRLDQISQGWAEVEAALDAAEGEVTPEVAATLDALNLAEREKIDGYVFFIRNLEGQAASYKAIEAELQAKRRTAENRITWLKQRVRDYMGERGTTELRGDIFRFALQRSGKPPIELLCPADKMPGIYTRLTYEADKVKLAADLAENLPAALAVARYGEPTVSLRIY